MRADCPRMALESIYSGVPTGARLGYLLGFPLGFYLGFPLRSDTLSN